jgi:2-amino-4-hydroxy-6-hydroxymethyldihydropteridine diphosphokinase
VDRVDVAIALGSNLGDRRAHLAFAIDRLALHLSDLRVSSVVETEPFEVPDAQPPYLNAAAVGQTALAPDELLGALMAIEQARGRRRSGVRGPRTLDLDLILYGDRIIDVPTLVVPHPEFRNRAFVLEPLSEVAAGWKDPVTGKTVGELLRQLRT